MSVRAPDAGPARTGSGAAGAECAAAGTVLGADVTRHLALARGLEWLLTNGAGAYACGTVAGLLTRPCHGLLTAPLTPLGQRLLLAKLEPEVRYGSEVVGLGCNEYRDGTIHPAGHERLVQFRREGPVVVFLYAIDDARLECRIWLARGISAVYVCYRLITASAPIELRLAPLVALRSPARAWAAGPAPGQAATERGCVVDDGSARLALDVDAGRFAPEPAWHYHFHHAQDGSTGDLYRPGYFTTSLGPGESVTVTATAGPAPAAGAALAAQRAYGAHLAASLPEGWPPWVRALGLSAEQCLVEPAGTMATVVCAVPADADRVRTALIALPGLTLATGHHARALKLLETYAATRHDGQLGPALGAARTEHRAAGAEAALWFFQAVGRYLAARPDASFARRVYPVLIELVSAFDRGSGENALHTASDGLLYGQAAGLEPLLPVRPGSALPRVGKPVETNALWHGAFCVLADVAALTRDLAAVDRWSLRAAHVGNAFLDRFWNEEAGVLYDLVDAPGGRPADPGLRAQQLLACTLLHPLLDAARTRRLVEACARALAVPAGLRVATDSDRVLAWPRAVLARAHLRAYGDPVAARAWLMPFEADLGRECLGQLCAGPGPDALPAGYGSLIEPLTLGEFLHAWLVTEPPATGRGHATAAG